MKGKRRRQGLPIGDVLREARLAKGLSQETLAFSAEIDRTFVSYLECGHKSPTLDTLHRIAGALGVAASELVKRAEKDSGAKH